MAYFWVNQKQTWKHEHEGGYLWAPKVSENDKPLHHWETMRMIESGDVIFSYVQGAIVATSVVKNRAYDSRRPEDFRKTATKWKQDGRRMDVAYQPLSNPVQLSKFVHDVPQRHSRVIDRHSAARRNLHFIPTGSNRGRKINPSIPQANHSAPGDLSLE